MRTCVFVHKTIVKLREYIFIGKKIRKKDAVTLLEYIYSNKNGIRSVTIKWMFLLLINSLWISIIAI
jgi:hypothetical protein